MPILSRLDKEQHRLAGSPVSIDRPPGALMVHAQPTFGNPAVLGNFPQHNQ
jgi:hypothetical protein